MKGYDSLLSNLSTKILIVKVLKVLDLWNVPVGINIDYQESYIQLNDSQAISSKSAIVSVIPLKDLFKIYNRYQRRLKAAHEFMSTSSFLITELKNVQNFKSYIFPFVTYFDENEVGVALGSYRRVNRLGML